MYLIELARTIQEDKERRIQEAGHRRRLLRLLPGSKLQHADASITTAATGASEPASRPAIHPAAHGRPRRPAQPCGPTPSTGPAAR